MKISNLLYMGALSTLALMSCTNNDDNSEWYGSEGIVFTTAIQSRVSGNTWNANDEVGIYMMNAGSGIEAATAQNKKYIAQTNGTLTAAPGNGIYLPESGNVDFIAYYPYTTSVSGNKLAVNVSDQSNPAAIDLIYSNGTKGVAATTATTISLGFTHQLTKVTLNVTKDETIETLNGLGVNIKGVSTEGEFNLADGTLTATAGTNNKDVAMYIDAQGTTATATATAIILPTAASTDQTSLNLTFNLNGQSFTHTISDASIFEKGTNVSFNAKLSINNGKPVVTVGNATISNWTEKPGGDINVDFDGGTQPGGETVVLDESFATGQGSFTIDDKQLPDGGSYVWKHDAGTTTGGNPYYYMKASSFIGGAKASESWLISPAVDLSQATTATLTFDHTHKFAGTPSEELTLWVTETSAENWQQLTIDKYGTNKDYTFVTPSIDLSAYAGKTIKFAFKYVSTTDAAGTWEIKNVKVVANGEGGGTVDPEPEPEPGNADLFISEYVEGSSNNKYIEIYNPTNETIDLSSYSLDLNTNGGESWSKDGGGFSSYSELSGTIGAKSTIVYKHAEAAIFEGEATTCGAANFNGNDPVGLFKNGTLIDIVGTFYYGGKPDFAKDVTLRRKSTVTVPSSTYDASQWETLSKDDVSGLGSHTMD